MLTVVLKNGRRIRFSESIVAESQENWVIIRDQPASAPLAMFPRENIEYVKFQKDRKE